MTIRDLDEYGKLASEHYQVERRIQKGEVSSEERRRFKEIGKKLSAISNFILDCKDPLIKKCMLHKFIELKSWEEVAASVGGYNSAGSCRMLVIRYLNRENRK